MSPLDSPEACLGRYARISGGRHGGAKGFIVAVSRGPVTGIPVFTVSVNRGATLDRIEVLAQNLSLLDLSENPAPDQRRTIP